MIIIKTRLCEAEIINYLIIVKICFYKIKVIDIINCLIFNMFLIYRIFKMIIFQFIFKNSTLLFVIVLFEKIIIISFLII